MKTVHISFYALLGEECGCRTETRETNAATVRELYEELRTVHGFRLPRNITKVAVNDVLAGWDDPLRDGDKVALLPPFSGG